MNNSDILATFRKHLSGIDEVRELSSTQIYNFGENMKGINEFIGAAQTLSLNLSKIRNLCEKIAWIDDLSKQESDEGTIRMYHTERNAHIANIKYILQGAKFMGIGLFDTELSCSINGRFFSINVASPLDEENMLEYCVAREDEVRETLSAVSRQLNGDESADSTNMANPAPKTQMRFGGVVLGEK